VSNLTIIWRFFEQPKLRLTSTKPTSHVNRISSVRLRTSNSTNAGSSNRRGGYLTGGENKERRCSSAYSITCCVFRRSQGCQPRPEQTRSKFGRKTGLCWSRISSFDGAPTNELVSNKRRSAGASGQRSSSHRQGLPTADLIRNSVARHWIQTVGWMSEPNENDEDLFAYEFLAANNYYRRLVSLPV
jgi:hypothetical protein